MSDSEAVDAPPSPTMHPSVLTPAAGSPVVPMILFDPLAPALGSEEEDGDEDKAGRKKRKVDEEEGGEDLIGGDDEKDRGRRKIEIEYIVKKEKRNITFSKRRAGIMKKAYELATLTGTQILLLVVSEGGTVYTFTTPKFEMLVGPTDDGSPSDGQRLIQQCLATPAQSDAEYGSTSPDGIVHAPLPAATRHFEASGVPLRPLRTRAYQPNMGTRGQTARAAAANKLDASPPLVPYTTRVQMQNYGPVSTMFDPSRDYAHSASGIQYGNGRPGEGGEMYSEMRRSSDEGRYVNAGAIAHAQASDLRRGDHYDTHYSNQPLHRPGEQPQHHQHHHHSMVDHNQDNSDHYQNADQRLRTPRQGLSHLGSYPGHPNHPQGPDGSFAYQEVARQYEDHRLGLGQDEYLLPERR